MRMRMTRCKKGEWMQDAGGQETVLCVVNGRVVDECRNAIKVVDTSRSVYRVICFSDNLSLLFAGGLE